MLSLMNRAFRSSRAMFKEVEVFVDGKPVMVDPTYTVFQAISKTGVTVPRFCFHERLAVAGNCRMCIVDVEKAPKPAAACAAPVMPGMRINTNSERTQVARAGVMEFLLANHPLDCPICDQGGECDLQDQSMLYGYKAGRFLEYKRAVEDKNVGPLVQAIMTRCIHCTRCIRFSDEWCGMPDLGTTGRGKETYVGSYVEKMFLTELSGNMVDLCPVGALTNAPYAFTARPWELRYINSYDVMDPLGPAIMVNTKGAELMRILPRNHDEINEEWIHDRSRHAFDGLKRQRINDPMERGPDGSYRPIAWDDALIKLAGHLNANNGDEIAGLIGEHVDIEGIVAFRDMMHRLGCENLQFRRSGAKLSPDFRGNYLFNSRVTGVDEADVMLIIGSCLKTEMPVLNARIRRAVNEGLQVFVIGSTETLTYDFEHLGTSPAVLKEIQAGSHPICKVLEDAEFPMVVVSSNALERDDGDALLSSVTGICEKYGVINPEEHWNGFNVLNKNIGSIGALEVGIPATFDAKASPKLVYLLGADNFRPDDIPEDAYVVYQGTHGDAGANRADLILPGAAYTEKSGTYVNIDGRVLITRLAVTPPGQARNEWEIMRALSEIMGQSLPYDSLTEIRFRIAELAPHLIKYDYIEPYNF